MTDASSPSPSFSSGGPVSGREARTLIEDRLRRPMLDELEAAVVLEAFGGLESHAALNLGREASRESSLLVGSHRVPPDLVDNSGIEWSAVISDIAFIVGVLAVGFWLSHQREAFGLDAVDRAWRLALPMSLGAQWFLRRRVLMGTDGLGRLRREKWLLTPAALCIVSLALVPNGGLVAAGLATTWVSGFLVSRRGWGLIHAGALLVVLSFAQWFSSYVVVCFVALFSVALAVKAVREAEVSQRLPGSMARSVPSGIVGICLALFLVAEPRVAWAASSPFASFTIVPALLGSVVGGLWMTKIWQVVPTDLSSKMLGQKSRSHGPLRVFGSAVVLTALTAVFFSLAVVWGSHRNGDEDLARTARALLVAHGALAVAGLFISVAEAFGSWLVSLVAALGGMVVAFSIGSVIHGAHPGLRILAGALVAIVVCLPSLLHSVARPAHRIAVRV